MEATTQPDFLKEHANEMWFILGAHFFAFFPWTIMNTIDIISAKWRTCRRTRKLAHIHLALSTLTIMIVAVYAEAQRRTGDNKGFAGALTALMFNIYQLMRTLMGLVQLNAFVAWCKHAVRCIRVLEGKDDHGSERVEGVGWEKARKLMKPVRQQLEVFASWRKRILQHMCTLLHRYRDNSEQPGERNERNIQRSVNVNGENGDAEENAEAHVGTRKEAGECTPKSREGVSSSRSGRRRHRENTKRIKELLSQNFFVSWWKRVSKCGGRTKVVERNEIEDLVMVNNIVVDNELGGREVTVLPSWKKVWRGVKEGKFTPRKWLWTDRVILNTIRWSGAYLCGIGEGWGVNAIGSRSGKECDEIFESFFSSEMNVIRDILSRVEWEISVERDSREFLRIRFPGEQDKVDLTGEMSTAYGSCHTNYDLRNTSTVDAYSFEFKSLVSSYPAIDYMKTSANREKIVVGLVHSVLLAKHLGVEKLKGIRRYYDRLRLPEGLIQRNAFKLLLQQTNTYISDESKIWEMFEPIIFNFPIFPYRMQILAVWDEETNWRVLQASAHQDIVNSLYYPSFLDFAEINVQQDRRNAPDSSNIFDHCTKCTIEQIDKGDFGWRGSLGVVMETVRTFLAEWITATPRQPNWKPEVPTVCVELNTGATSVYEDYSFFTWTCQRELQREVAKVSNMEENFPGNAALIMLFILGFPLLRMENCENDFQGSEDEVHEASASPSSNLHRNIDLSVDCRRAWAPLAPQDISLIIQINETKGTVSMRLRNDSDDSHFIWQDWLDAAMGCMKGFEESKNSKKGYGRRIVRPNLRKPMVQMCPLRVEEREEDVVERTSTARVWMGWPAFDVRICKFELDQWFDAWDFSIREDWRTREIVLCFEEVIQAIVSAENDEVDACTVCSPANLESD